MMAIVRTTTKRYCPANQSKEHADLVRLARVWACSRATARGSRHAEEVWLDPGYVADLVSLQRFSNADQIAFTGVAKMCLDLAIVFEAKASRADFLSTFGPSPKHKNRLTPIGHLHFVVAAKGICDANEIPDPWGFLVPYGMGLSVRKKPVFTPDAGDKHIYEIAWTLLWKNEQGYYRRRW